MAKVTGIGGVFFKAKTDEGALREWYRLRDGGVAVHQGPESHENGKFVWLLDPDGNKVELWEPKNWDSKNKAA